MIYNPAEHSRSTALSPRPVFIVSDRSGVTAETICHTLLSQFPGIEFQQNSLPFIDSESKIRNVVQQINQAGVISGQRPLVFTTFAEEKHNRSLGAASAEIFDVFAPYISRMEETLGQQASHEMGQSHGIADAVRYGQRINAVNYAMHCDDGLHTRDYGKADIILLGVSRSGKTPTCLYLALHFGFQAANYPLTEEDFEHGELPDSLHGHLDKVFGLMIDHMRLHQIRSERRPDSQYASLAQCEQDLTVARRMYQRYNIPNCDSTNYSVEELGSTIKHRMGLQSSLY